MANHAAIQAFHVYLFEQIAMGHNSIIDDLVSSGIPADLADDSDTADSTLHWAISFNHIDVAENLLNLGVPVNITNNQGKSCLHLACQSSNSQFLKLLMKWGADVLLEDETGKIAEDYIKADRVELKDILNTPVEEVMTSPIKLRKGQSSSSENSLEDEERSSVYSKVDQVQDGPLEKATKGDENINDSSGSYVVLDNATGHAVHLKDDQVDGVDNNSRTDSTRSSETNPHPSLPSSSSASSVSSDDEESPQLILWPPAQRQFQYQKKAPHVIGLDHPLLISCDADFSDILNSSRLISTLDGVGVQTDVQAKGKHAGSHLRLCIDRNVCPARHSFNLHIDHSSIRLIAADNTGLLYAINAFVQILKLHSDYITNPPADTENKSLIVNFIKIPSMTIYDWPNVANRAVLWSYPRDTRTKYAHMQDFLVFMSEVRLNQLFLRIDCGRRETDNLSTLPSQEGGEGRDEVGLDEYSLELIALDHLCQQYCIECVPTIVFTSTQQTIPDVVLNRRFQCTTVTVVFALCKDAEEGDIACKSSTLAFVQARFQDLLRAGYNSIVLSCSEWMMRGEGKGEGAEQNYPVTIAVELGLNAVVIPFEHIFADVSLSRSLTATKAYAKPFIEQTKEILHVKKQNALALMPAMTASDFFYPIILLKHMCFLHSGATWNHDALEDILGSYVDDHTMLRPALSTLLFQTYNPSDAETYNSEEVFQNALLDIFTNDDSTNVKLLTASCSSHSNLNDQYSLRSGTGDSSIRSSAQIEGAIWNLVSATDSCPNMQMPVSKEEAIHTLKRTKRILSAVNWKVAESKTKSLSMLVDESLHGSSMSISMIETEEYMRILNLVNTVCRTVIMAWNSAQKPVLPLQAVNPVAITQGADAVPSFEHLMDSLSPGTSSDLANAILESMTLCGSVWTERLNAKYFTTGSQNPQEAFNYTYNSLEKGRVNMCDILVERHIHVQRAELPLLAVFGAICKHMPAFSPDVLMKIFEEGVVTMAPVTPTRSWSLWG